MTDTAAGVFDVGDGRRELRATVAIVGAGPAGLTAARHLAGQVPGRVVVLDREHRAGGVPRYCDHLGYGRRDLGRFTTGPKYAARLNELAVRAGALVRTGVTVTGWDGAGLRATSPDGLLTIRADAVLLATGARERPRSARRVYGSRPDGVLTGGTLQQLVHLQGKRFSGRAVVVGAEQVGWSAAATLRAAGAEPVALTSVHAQPESPPPWTAVGGRRGGIPVQTRTRVIRLLGHDRLTGVEVQDLDSGERRVVPCELVVFTADWIPEHELARTAGLSMDPGSLGPVTDASFRTSRPGVFAAGNLVHPVEVADVAALDGRAAARAILRHLQEPVASAGPRLIAEEPFRWVWPQVMAADDGPLSRDRLLLWSDRHVRFPVVEVRQGGELVSRRRVAWPVSPGRVFRVPSTHLDRVRPRDGDIHIGLG